MSCEQVARPSLNVFYDWKVHPRGSREGSRETFWVNLAIGASTHEQVTKLSREKSKNPDLKNINK